MNLRVLSKNKRGATIISFIIVAPFLIYFILYVVYLSMFFVKINEMKLITNNILNRAVIVGQFTTTLKDNLIYDLSKSGYEKDKLVIDIKPLHASDSRINTYVKRGNNITINIIYKVPNNLYYLNFGIVNKTKFYINVKLTGMSEKW